MKKVTLDKVGNQILIHTSGDVCTSGRDIIESTVFREIVSLYCQKLRDEDSSLLDVFPEKWKLEEDADTIVYLIRCLSVEPLSEVVKKLDEGKGLVNPESRKNLHKFVSTLYDYWRWHDRFLVLHDEPRISVITHRPYRAFVDTIEVLNGTVRGVYRDICENILGRPRRVYRELPAGCNVGLVAIPVPAPLPDEYEKALGGIPFIRRAWIAPPVLFDPPMNKRTGSFLLSNKNPVPGTIFARKRWLCYPAQVGPVTVFTYFHPMFAGLGCSLVNLFDVASDEQIAKGPDAILVFGAPPAAMRSYGDLPLVIYDDEDDDIMVGAIPAEERFAYFGYLKKTMLTLHNIVMMKKKKLPFHGAMVSLSLKGGKRADLLVIGDSGAGKSETLEALRIMEDSSIRDMTIIADDMGSLEIRDGKVTGYGTEIGAFVRLDDLDKGYAFALLDRSILMSPQRTNARVVVPVTTMDVVLQGHSVDYLLYANNYETVDDAHPVLDRFSTAKEALDVFAEGAAMAKGTTTASGLQKNYFANIFGPPLYKKLHDELAAEIFKTAVESGVFVGQLRTQLGVPEVGARGPDVAAGVLLDLLRSSAPVGK